MLGQLTDAALLGAGRLHREADRGFVRGAVAPGAGRGAGAG